MKYMDLFRRGYKIYTEEGVKAFIKKAALWAEKNMGLRHGLTILKFMVSGRTYYDSKWLLENKSDRQDALVSQPSTWDTYHGFDSRESHQARYTFAANKLDTYHDSGNIRVLDVASGTGYGSKILEKRSDTTINYYGCEIDPFAIKYSKNYYPSSYIQGNVESLPLKDDIFDGIVSLETMEHIPNVDQYFQELRRVSVDSSKLIISTPCDEDLDFNIENTTKEYPHKHTFNFKEIKCMLNRHFPNSDIEIYVQFKRYVSEPKNTTEKIEKASNTNISEGDYFLIEISR